jgi:UDP-GlcNAc:undecaprenyl-phosphate GlcNAc-1-phosphate transferase
MVMLKLIFALAISFLITFYLVPIMRSIAFKFGILDVPDGKVKMHKQSTPYLGGLAIYLGFITTLALVFPFANEMFLFMVGATLLLFVGLIDDLLIAQPYQKFGGQIIAALCFLKAGLFLKESFFIHHALSIPLSFLWLLTVINAFNLVDIMDGLATTLAICATISFLLISLALQNYNAVLLLGSFLGALVAFWWYNKPSAQIYLGDAGSLFIGGFLAAFPFFIKWGGHNQIGIFAPAILLAVPLLEVVSLVIIRSYKGIPFYRPSPDHFALYLQNNGWSKWQILSYLSAISCILFIAAWLLVTNHISISFLCGSTILFLLGWFWIMRSKLKKNPIYSTSLPILIVFVALYLFAT